MEAALSSNVGVQAEVEAVQGDGDADAMDQFNDYDADTLTSAAV